MAGRRTLIALLAVLMAAPCGAQEWARKMFETTSHDYGTVARGAKSEFRFVLTNIYKEDAHISSVRASCGCVTPEIVTKDAFKTWEKAEIVAKFNTRTFIGQRRATITVTFDKPFYAEVQLQISGYIRTDVVVDPGQVDLGEIDRGEGAEKTVKITYAGRSDWKILEVKSPNDSLESEVIEKSRANGRVAYELKVRLKDDAPSGLIEDQLTLVTNDRRAPQFPVIVQGRVVADVTLSPSQLYLGAVKQGEVVSKQLVVRGREAFKVLSVECEDSRFQFTIPDEAKTVHMIAVKFEAGTSGGKISQKLRVRTDANEQDWLECQVLGTVSTGATVTSSR